MFRIFVNTEIFYSFIKKNSLNAFATFDSLVMISPFSTGIILSLDLILFEKSGETHFRSCLLP